MSSHRTSPASAVLALRRVVQRARALARAFGADPDTRASAGEASALAGAPALTVDLAEMYRKVPRNEDGTPTFLKANVQFDRDKSPVMRFGGRALAGYGTVTRVDLEGEPDYERRDGHSGTPYRGGVPAVDMNAETTPFRARGLSYRTGIFRQFTLGDPIASPAILKAVRRMMGGRVEWRVPERLNATNDQAAIDRCKEHAEYLNGEVHHNEDIAPRQVLEEMLKHVIDGFSIHEFGLDTADGRAHLSRLELRAANSIQHWIFGPGERLIGATQTGMMSGWGVGGGRSVLDMRKCILITHNGEGLNYEGHPIGRSTYIYDKAKLEWLQSGIVHRQRFGPGFPVFRQTGDGQSADEKTIKSINDAATKFYYSPKAYMSLPKNVLMELQTVNSDPAFVPAMEYFDSLKREALGVLHDQLGQTAGSYSLGVVRDSEYEVLLRSWAGEVAQALDKLGRALVLAQYGPQDVYPVPEWTGVVRESRQEMIEVHRGFADLRKSGGLTQAELRGVRDRLGIVQDEEEDVEDEATKQPLNGPQIQSGVLIMQSFAAGTLGLNGALQLLLALGMTREDAESALSDAPERAVDPEDTDRTTEPVTRARQQGQGARMRAHGRADEECQCCQSISARNAKGNGKVVSTSVNGTVVGVREMTQAEGKVRWNAIMRSLTAAEQSLQEGVHAVYEEHHERFVAEAEPLIADEDWQSIARLHLDMEPLYRDALMRGVQVMGEEVRAEALAEMAELGGSLVSGGTYEPSDEVLAAVELATSNLNETANAQMRLAAIHAAQHGDLQPLQDWVMSSRLIDQFTSEVIGQVLSDAREEAAEEAFAGADPADYVVQYSAMMDEDMCDECGSRDGDWMLASEDDMEVPNPDCYSTRGGENRCRCIKVWYLRTAFPEA